MHSPKTEEGQTARKRKRGKEHVYQRTSNVIYTIMHRNFANSLIRTCLGTHKTYRMGDGVIYAKSRRIQSKRQKMYRHA